MKKNFVKKLALGLALVMAVTSVPASSEAAAAPGFKSSAVKVRVGQTKKYSTENSKKYSVKFKIGNKKVATIKYTAGSKSVKVTGVAEGKTTLRADFKSYKTKKVTTAKVPVTVLAAKVETPVVEEATLVSVKQTAANAFEATFTTDAREKVTAASFAEIKSQGEGYTATVDTLTWSADGKTVLATTFGNFVDKAVYDVTCNGKTASFTASIGEVTSIVIDTVQAKAGIATNIEFRLFDAAGIDVTNAIDLNTNVIVSVTGDYSYVETAKASTAKITMATAGETAEVTVTYSKYDGTVDVTRTATITCIDNTVVAGAKEFFTVGDGNNYEASVPRFYLDSYTANTTLYMDAPKTGYFTAVDAKGNAIAYDEYEVMTSNEAVVEVSEAVIDGKCATFTLDPVSTGTAQITIKAVKDGKAYTYTKAVTVKAARVATTIGLSSSSVALSQNGQTAVIGAYVLDQYGKNMYLPIGAEDVTNANTADDVSASHDNYHSLLFVSTQSDGDSDDGSHVVELTASDVYGNVVTKKFSVKVNRLPAETANNVNYKLVVDTKTIDLNPENLCGSDCTLASGTHALTHLNTNVRLARYVGGVFDKYVATPVDKDGNDITDGNAGVTVTVKKGTKTFDTDLTVSGAAVGATVKKNTMPTTAVLNYRALTSLTSTSIDMATDMAETGTYTVTAEYTINGKVTKKSATFTVKNTMELPTIKVVSTVATSPSAIKDECLTTDVDMFEVNGNESISDVLYVYTNGTVKSAMAGTLPFNSNDRLTFNRVVVSDFFNGVTYTYYVPFTRTITED